MRVTHTSSASTRALLHHLPAVCPASCAHCIEAGTDGELFAFSGCEPQIRCKQVVEAGLGHLPFKERTVMTPTGQQYVGVDFAKRLCGVSIIRSGESMENALRACCQGIKIGKILVHR
jgi:Uracil phosphoribosyltransferase